MGDLVNEFSWSPSRDRLFAECRRKYYFRHYGSWGGWEVDADDRVREIYRLKQLQNRFTLAGHVVHEVVKRVLDRFRYSSRFSVEEAVDDALGRLRAFYRASREGHPAPKAPRLFEHEYEVPLSDSAWVRMRERVVDCVTNFMDSEIFEVIRATPMERWLPIDHLDSFDFEGVKVYVAPDFAMRNEMDNALVLDWKTGRRSDGADRTQVVVYGLFAWEKWRMEPRRTVAEIHYLLTTEKEVVTLDEAALQSGRETIRRSVAAMRALLDDPAANRASEERFPRTPDRDTCRMCNWRRICWPDWPDVGAA